MKPAKLQPEQANKAKSLYGSFVPIFNGRFLYNKCKDNDTAFVVFLTLVPVLILLIGRWSKLVENVHFGVIVFFFISCTMTVYLLMKSWLTEPGIEIRKDEEEEIQNTSEAQRNISSLLSCVRNNRLDTITKALSHNTSLVNECNIEGRTILHAAVLVNKPNIVSLILKYKPDVNKRDNYNLTPMHYASFQNYMVVCDLLFEYIGVPHKRFTNEREKYRLEVLSIVPEYNYLKNCYVLHNNKREITDIRDCTYTIPQKTIYATTNERRDAPSSATFKGGLLGYSSSSTPSHLLSLPKRKGSLRSDNLLSVEKEEDSYNTRMTKSKRRQHDDYASKAPLLNSHTFEDDEDDDEELNLIPNDTYMQVYVDSNSDSNAEENTDSTSFFTNSYKNEQKYSNSDDPSESERNSLTNSRSSIISTPDDSNDAVLASFHNTVMPSSTLSTHSYTTQNTNDHSTSSLYRATNANQKVKVYADKVEGRPKNSASSSSSGSAKKFYSYMCINEGSIVMIRRCSICHIFQPPRCIHCRTCSICIRGFDHHCPWIGNCVGIRNHIYFVLFLLFAELSLLLGLLLSSWSITLSLALSFSTSHTVNMLSLLKDCWAEFVFFFCCIALIAPLGNLLGYHLYLISKNCTTHEGLSIPTRKDRKKQNMSNRVFYPYDNGIIKNWYNAIRTVLIKSTYRRE